MKAISNTPPSSGNKGQHHHEVQGGHSSSCDSALMRPICLKSICHLRGYLVRAHLKVYYCTCKAGNVFPPATLGSCTGLDTHILSDTKGTPRGSCQLIRGLFPRAGTNGPCLRGVHPLRFLSWENTCLPWAAGTSPLPEAVSMFDNGNLPAGSIIELWLCWHQQEWGPRWKDMCAALEDMQFEELSRRCKG